MFKNKWVNCSLLGIMLVFCIQHCLHAEPTAVEEFNITELMERLADESRPAGEFTKIWNQIHELSPDGQKRVLNALIYNLHHSDNCRLASECAFWVYTFKNDEAVDALAVTLLNHKDEFMRQKAARLLGKIGNAKAIPALQTAIDADDGFNEDGTRDYRRRYSGDIASVAIITLGRIGKPAVPALLQLWQKKGVCERFKIEIVGSLGETRDEKAIRVLIDVLEGNDGAIRPLAAFGLGEFATKDVLPVLMKHQDDPDNKIRQNVAEAIKKLKGELKRLSE